MMKNKNLIIIFLVLGIISLSIISQSKGIFADSSALSYCAEKTTYNASCQNVPFSQVNTNYRYAPTSCQSTTYCSTGTCVDTKQGTCLPSPQATCDPTKGGNWYPSSPANTPQCQQGCCLIGDQASFTTQANCNALSSLYGINVNFEASVTDEIQCLASATPEAQGACVYQTSNNVKTCSFTTKQNCQNLNATFYQDFLCTNPTLGTNCNPTTNTECIAGQDQVYFVDSCGNQANVYDASKVNPTNINYWSYVADGTHGFSLEATANPTNSNSLKSNGNCNYLSGTTCMQYNSSIDPTRPTYGNYICRSLSCNQGPYVNSFESAFDSGGRSTAQGTSLPNYPVNGETWCGTQNGNSIQIGGNPGISGTTLPNLDKTSGTNGINNPGSRDLRFICYNGQVTIQPCADFRNQICVESQVNGVQSGACVTNRWRDCYSQTTQADCLNTDQRDCQWITGLSILKDNTGQPLVYNSATGSLVSSSSGGTGASCVPKYPPGFDLNSSSVDATQICSLANTNCFVTFQHSIIGPGSTPSVQGSVTCLDYQNGKVVPVQSWLNNYENLCMSLGDCGVSANYVQSPGYYNQNNLFVISGGLSTNYGSGS